MNKRSFLAMLCLLALLASSCLSQAAAEAVPEEARFGGTMTYAMSADPLNINMFASAGNTIDGQIASAILDPLVIYSPEAGGYIGKLLESWEMTEDGKEWTMHVRPGMKWHDGQPITAEDVVFTLEYLRSPDIDIPSKSIVPPADEVYEVVDELTYKITTPYPNPNELAAWIYIYPKHIWKDVPPSNFSNAPEGRERIGSGPFKLEEYKAGEYLRFSRFDDYYEGRPYLDEVIYRIIPDRVAQVAALESGQVDVIFSSIAAVEPLMQNPAVKTFSAPSGNSTTLYMNTTQAPFDDILVRKAMLHAINREVLVQQVLRGFGEAVYSDFVPTDFYYYADAYKGYDCDAEKAKALLTEAGYTMGGDGYFEKDGKRLTVELSTLAFDNSILIMTEDLKQAGIELTYKEVSQTEFSEIYGGANNDYQALLSGRTLGPDPARYALLYASTPNFMRYEDPEIKALFDLATTSLDKKEVEETYVTIQKKLADLAYNMNLWHRFTIYAHSANLVIDEAIPAGNSFFFFYHMAKVYRVNK